MTLTVDLAGDEPAPVAGIVLNPTGGEGFPEHQVRSFDLLLSSDGQTYTLSKLKGKTVVLAWFPKAFTGG